MSFDRSFSVARVSFGSFYGEEIARTDDLEKAVLVALSLSMESWNPDLVAPSDSKNAAQKVSVV